MALGALVFTAVSSLPVPLVSDPVGVGPRYYFLPFVAFGWTLLVIVRKAPLPALAIASGVLLLMSFLNLATTFARSPQMTAAKLSWRTELVKCAASKAPVVHVTIYFDGPFNFWTST
jgi:hypothetical protein